MTKGQNTICVLPWMHLATNPAGQLRLCCNSLPGLNLIREDKKTFSMGVTGDVARAWSADSLREVRRQMLAGERPAACVRCFREEDSGLRSARQAWNQQYSEDVTTLVQTTTADGSAPQTIKYMDLRFGNLCNLKCRMCNPYSSHKWLEDWEELNGAMSEKERHRLQHMDWFESEEFWENLKPQLHSVDQIYLTGGEPMLSKAHVRLLDYLSEEGLASRIVIKYNTNLTVLPPKVLARWKSFKEVRVNCSLDGIGLVNDYIRHPSRWSEVDSNLRALDQLAAEHRGVKLTVHFTFQALNALNLFAVLDYLATFQHIKKLPFVNVLNHPTYLNVRVLPEDMKREFCQRLKTWLDEHPIEDFAESRDMWTRIQDLAKYVTDEDLRPAHFAEFVSKMNTLDQLRGQNYADFIPDLRGYIPTAELSL